MQVMVHNFYVHNVGDLPVSLTWKMPSLFSVQPPACEDLQPGGTCGFEASFIPSEAAVFTGSAICALSTGSTSIMRVTAIGKFPYLSVDSGAVAHGQVLVGATSTASVKLLNQSLVPANFTVSDDLPKDDKVFRLSPANGCIPPGESLVLRLVYTPRFPGATSAVHYTIKTPGGNMVALQQTGSALGATVALTDRFLGFGDILLGSSMRKVLNASDSSLHDHLVGCIVPWHWFKDDFKATGATIGYHVTGLCSRESFQCQCPVHRADSWPRNVLSSACNWSSAPISLGTVCCYLLPSLRLQLLEASEHRAGQHRAPGHRPFWDWLLPCSSATTSED